MISTKESFEILKELINIGVGRGANVLNTMLASHIELQVPDLKTLSFEKFVTEMEAIAPGKLAVVDLGFDDEFSGSVQLIFPTEVASKLVHAMTGEEDCGDDFDSIRAGTFTEIGNIVLNSVVGSFANLLKLHLNYRVPDYLEGYLNDIMKIYDNMESTRAILLAKTRFLVQEFAIHGDIALFVELDAFEELMSVVDNKMIDHCRRMTDDERQTSENGGQTTDDGNVVAG